MTTKRNPGLIIAPTVLLDLDEATYHADGLCPEKSLSSSMAKLILQPAGPARLREQLDNPAPRKRAFDFGTAAHEKILGRGQPVIGIDGNRNATAVKAEIAAAEAEGFLVLKRAEVAAVDAMAEAILRHQLAADLLTAGEGKPEVSMFGVDDQTGRWLRGRLDFLHSDGLIVDYKTAQSASPRDFERAAWTFGYHIQAAHYLGLAVALDLVASDAEYWLIVQEKTPPFLPAVYRLDSELLEEGARQVRRAIDLWDRCQTLDDWPGFPSAPQTVTAPRWATTEGDDL